jgi:hypothetical protein
VLFACFPGVSLSAAVVWPQTLVQLRRANVQTTLICQQSKKDLSYINYSRVHRSNHIKFCLVRHAWRGILFICWYPRGRFL